MAGAGFCFSDELGEKRPKYICLKHSIMIWDPYLFPKDIKRHLVLWGGGTTRMENFIRDIYVLDGEAIWGKYKIHEFAWSLCKTGGENEPITMLVETPEIISSTNAVATLRLHTGDYERNCMVLDDEQAAVARKASCITGCPLGGKDNSSGTNGDRSDDEGDDIGGD